MHSESNPSPGEGNGIDRVLGGAGSLGRDLLNVDWGATPLGPPTTWSHSLRTAVQILVSSRFSMWMAWGPELTFLCNEAYRRDTLGAKYPWALGRPARQVWAEIWADIGPRIDSVLATGTATWDDELQLFLERSGFPEETYHTFSYSPLRDDDGVVAGMLCVVSENTDGVIGERRMATLRGLGAATTGLHDQSELLEVVRTHLGANDQDFPFSLVYLFEEEGERAVLAAAAGIVPGSPLAPVHLGPGPGAPGIGDGHPWPLDPPRTEPAVIELDRLGPGAPTGAWSEPPTRAAVAPLVQRGSQRRYGVLVTGLNRYRPLDQAYRAFTMLVADQVAAGITGARAYQEERRRAEELAALDAAKTAFFTNISHELRTPLTLLLGPSEDALSDPEERLGPRQRQRAEVVLRNAQRLLRLVNTLLEFSRLEAGRAEGRFEPTDLGRYTAELASMFRSAADEAGLELVVEVQPIEAYVDRDMWAKIVLNLLSNALKFTLEGTINVRLRRAGEEALLQVADTGIGIDPADQPNVFERFERARDDQARAHEGTGIGLALVAELTELHGGTVGLESTPGEGSTFSVRLPLGSHHLPREQVVERGTEVTADPRQVQGYLAEIARWGDRPRQRAGEPSGASTPSGADGPRPAPAGAADQHAADDRPVVLVVDDNADMREYVVGLLRSEYEVVEAVDGQDALASVATRVPDLVVSDVMMPRLDGFGLLEELQADPATSSVPVLILSARAGEEGVVEGLQAGANDYLVKPFAPRELLARVRANLELDRVRRTRDHLQRSREELDRAQRLAGIGSWELDLGTGRTSASSELLRQLQITWEQLEADGLGAVAARCVHPDDRPLVDRALRAVARGEPVDYEARFRLPDGRTRRFHAIAEVERDPGGRPVKVRGTNQDVTELRDAEQRLAEAAAAAEASAREHRLASELQASLLPPRRFEPEHLEVATYYRAGVEGTQVGGDWFDVIELGAGRTALVVGDVMGRGVRAAAVMAQVRSAIRAYALLDLPPSEVLELTDQIVSTMSGDELVTAVYAVFEPGDRRLRYATAGHLPPLLATPGRDTLRLEVSGAPPLGTGIRVVAERQLVVPVGSTIALYTDGLVERRDHDLDDGIDALAERLRVTEDPLNAAIEPLVDSVVPGDPDDDVALLLARVGSEAAHVDRVSKDLEGPADVAAARHLVAETLMAWGATEEMTGRAMLMTSELTTNAILHGSPPGRLEIRRSGAKVTIEVSDASRLMPRRLRAAETDEHGRGLLVVAGAADAWGARATPDGKAVWSTVTLRN